MKLQLCGMNVNAISVGGHYTSILFPSYRIAIDMGICSQSALRCDQVFFTHPHTDHMNGVVQHCSTREMMGLSPPHYFVGAEHAENFQAMLAAWRKLSHSNMKCHVHPFAIDQTHRLSKKLQVKSFRSIHRVPCQGYIITETRQKILPEYRHYSGPELAKLRHQKIAFTKQVSTPVAAYTGDTSFAVFSRNQELCHVKLLIMEITFCNDSVSPQKAKKHGHIHIDDVVNGAHLLQNEHILVMHLSARHSHHEATKTMQKKLPAELFSRMTILPNEMLF